MELTEDIIVLKFNIRRKNKGTCWLVAVTKLSTGSRNQDHPQKKLMQKGKMVV